MSVRSLCGALGSGRFVVTCSSRVQLNFFFAIWRVTFLKSLFFLTKEQWGGDCWCLHQARRRFPGLYCKACKYLVNNAG